MRGHIVAALAAAVASCGAAAAQDADVDLGRYYALGAQAAFGVERVDRDDGVLAIEDNAGYGAFGRYGVRKNRYFALEGELGFATFPGGTTYGHGGGYAVGILPLGPVDLRGRLGVSASVLSDTAVIGLYTGLGIGVRTGPGQSIRLDLNPISDELSDTGEVGALVQLGYQRSF